MMRAPKFRRPSAAEELRDLKMTPVGSLLKQMGPNPVVEVMMTGVKAGDDSVCVVVGRGPAADLVAQAFVDLQERMERVGKWSAAVTEGELPVGAAGNAPTLAPTTLQSHGDQAEGTVAP